MKALFIEHDHVSLGGPIWRAFESRGYEIDRFLIVPEEKYHAPNVSVTFPEFNQYEVIVPMGAPYAAYDDERIGNWLLPELEKLRDAHQSGIPILGICFGGQLMARALGGKVSRSPKAELGWYEIETDDPALIPAGPWFEYHWDRWQSPPGAREIARTSIAPQAFVMGRTLALQFHPEIDPEVLEEWLAMEGGCVEVESEGVNVDELRARTRAESAGAEKRAHDLVEKFLTEIAVNPIIAPA